MHLKNYFLFLFRVQISRFVFCFFVKLFNSPKFTGHRSLRLKTNVTSNSFSLQKPLNQPIKVFQKQRILKSFTKNKIFKYVPSFIAKFVWKPIETAKYNFKFDSRHIELFWLINLFDANRSKQNVERFYTLNTRRMQMKGIMTLFNVP